MPNQNSSFQSQFVPAEKPYTVYAFVWGGENTTVALDVTGVKDATAHQSCSVVESAIVESSVCHISLAEGTVIHYGTSVCATRIISEIGVVGN